MSARPSSPSAGAPGAGSPAMPVSARVAVGVLAGLAVLLLLSALLTLVAREAVIDTLAQAQPDQPRSAAEQIVLINLVQSIVFGVLSGVSALFLARRRGWARWAGLAATLLLGLITLGAVVISGGVPVTSLLVLVLCAAGVASLLAATTAAWAPTGPRSRS